MIRPDHPTLSIVRQCRLVSISRSSFYHVSRGETAWNLALMGEIDRQFLETPFYGARQMTWHLRAQGHLKPEGGAGGGAKPSNLYRKAHFEWGSKRGVIPPSTHNIEILAFLFHGLA